MFLSKTSIPLKRNGEGRDSRTFWLKGGMKRKVEKKGWKEK